MISVVIPAHDEEKAIGRCLTAITSGMRPGEIDVVVVCNGCRDATAEVARTFGEGVRVIESEVASKSNALNLGDASARGFPRFYVDADVELSAESIRRVAEVLRTNEHVLAAAPRMHVKSETRSWPVRAYYDIWTRLPYVAEAMTGSGVYALSERGRARFDRFPDITSDDGYVRLLFSPEERVTVEDCRFAVEPPTSLRGVIHIKTRSQKGCLELRRAFPELMVNERRSYARPLRGILRQPLLWPSLIVYSYVFLATRARAYWKYHFAGLGDWERDEESRAAGPS